MSTSPHSPTMTSHLDREPSATELQQAERRKILRRLLAELAAAREEQPDWYAWVVEQRQQRLGLEA
jgi:hypothetical protein